MDLEQLERIGVLSLAHCLVAELPQSTTFLPQSLRMLLPLLPGCVGVTGQGVKCTESL